MSEEKRDWKEVVALAPRGYVELRKDGRLSQGPVTGVSIIATDYVRIRCAWLAWVALSESGEPSGEWQRYPCNPGVSFENFTVPFVIEDIPTQGKRVKTPTFSLYLTDVSGMNPGAVRAFELSKEQEPH